MPDQLLRSNYAVNPIKEDGVIDGTIIGGMLGASSAVGLFYAPNGANKLQDMYNKKISGTLDTIDKVKNNENLSGRTKKQQVDALNRKLNRQKKISSLSDKYVSKPAYKMSDVVFGKDSTGLGFKSAKAGGRLGRVALGASALLGSGMVLGGLTDYIND
ncbi:MAG: hypothetical protein N2043_02350 [Ignavibacterium sp.]|nr:hypothetical protein [Ignavibacterium sp.]